jgi:tetratricopeptide (TPR) repeat protein
LTRSIELDPKDLESRLHLINLYWTCARYRKAEEQCRYAVQLFPESSVAHWAYGDFLACTDRGRERAESLLRKAIELDDENASAYYSYGKALLKWERWQEARNMLERAHQLGDERALVLLKAHTSPE